MTPDDLMMPLVKRVLGDLELELQYYTCSRLHTRLEVVADIVTRLFFIMKTDHSGTPNIGSSMQLTGLAMDIVRAVIGNLSSVLPVTSSQAHYSRPTAARITRSIHQKLVKAMYTADDMKEFLSNGNGTLMAAITEHVSLKAIRLFQQTFQRPSEPPSILRLFLIASDHRSSPAAGERLVIHIETVTSVVTLVLMQIYSEKDTGFVFQAHRWPLVEHVLNRLALCGVKVTKKKDKVTRYFNMNEVVCMVNSICEQLVIKYDTMKSLTEALSYKNRMVSRDIGRLVSAHFDMVCHNRKVDTPPPLEVPPCPDLQNLICGIVARFVHSLVPVTMADKDNLIICLLLVDQIRFLTEVGLFQSHNIGSLSCHLKDLSSEMTEQLGDMVWNQYIESWPLHDAQDQLHTLVMDKQQSYMISTMIGKTLQDYVKLLCNISCDEHEESLTTRELQPPPGLSVPDTLPVVKRPPGFDVPDALSPVKPPPGFPLPDASTAVIPPPGFALPDSLPAVRPPPGFTALPETLPAACLPPGFAMPSTPSPVKPPPGFASPETSCAVSPPPGFALSGPSPAVKPPPGFLPTDVSPVLKPPPGFMSTVKPPPVLSITDTSCAVKPPPGFAPTIASPVVRPPPGFMPVDALTAVKPLPGFTSPDTAAAVPPPPRFVLPGSSAVVNPPLGKGFAPSEASSAVRPAFEIVRPDTLPAVRPPPGFTLPVTSTAVCPLPGFAVPNSPPVVKPPPGFAPPEAVPAARPPPGFGPPTESADVRPPPGFAPDASATVRPPPGFMSSDLSPAVGSPPGFLLPDAVCVAKPPPGFTCGMVTSPAVRPPPGFAPLNTSEVKPPPGFSVTTGPAAVLPTPAAVRPPPGFALPGETPVVGPPPPGFPQAKPSATVRPTVKRLPLLHPSSVPRVTLPEVSPVLGPSCEFLSPDVSSPSLPKCSTPDLCQEVPDGEMAEKALKMETYDHKVSIRPF